MRYERKCEWVFFFWTQFIIADWKSRYADVTVCESKLGSLKWYIFMSTPTSRGVDLVSMSVCLSIRTSISQKFFPVLSSTKFDT